MAQGYETVRDGDALLVKDVEIMGELPVGAAGNKIPLDAEWLQSALSCSQARAAKDYLAPVHVYHSKDGQPGTFDHTIQAGSFKLTGIRDGEDADGYKGKVLVGDIRLTNPEIAEQYLQGRLPYRSAEILRPSSKRLDSLALLPSAPPHFKFGMLQPKTGWRLAQTLGRPGEGMIFLAEKEEPEPKEGEHDSPEPRGEFVEGDEKDYDEADDLDRDATECVFETHEMVMELVDLLHSLANPGSQTPYNPPRGARMAESSEIKPTETVPLKLADAPEFKALQELVGKQAGDLAALRAKLDAADKASADQRTIAEAVASLAEWPEEAVKFAEAGIKDAMKAGGKDAVDACVKIFKAATPKDVKPGEAAGAKHSTDSAAVLKFAQKPEDLAEARRFAQQYPAVKKLGVIPGDMSEEKYVETQMKARALPVEGD